MKTTNNWSRESGASIVSVMVAMSLFAVVAVMASQSFRNIGTSGRKAEAAMSARDAESIVVQALVQRYKDFVNRRCVDNPVNYFSGVAIGNLATTRWKNVSFNGPDSERLKEKTDADVSRCNQTAFSQNAADKSNTFYSCLNLDIDPNTKTKATQEAFASNRGAFIEMFVRLRNLQTDSLTTCENMIPNSAYGFEVFYSLHWATPAGESTMYDSKTGSLNVALTKPAS